MMSQYDVVVVGAGIHGAGVAQACALNGLSTLLLEQSAIAAGTSSKSSKLIHGGLRYLESGHFKLVRECLQERQTLLRLAPELVHPIPFLIPHTAKHHRPAWQLSVGLALYSLLTGFTPLSRFRTLSRDDPLVPSNLSVPGLTRIFQYWDAQTDDRELTRRVVASAEALGAKFECPATMNSADKTENGYRVQITSGNNRYSVETRFLVNATGPWVNDLLETIKPTTPMLPIDLVQGAHLVLDCPAPKCCLYLEAPQDARAVFVMPWRGKVLLGTTETLVDKATAKPEPTQGEIDYLSEVYQYYFAGPLPPVIGQFAGLRVIPKSAGRIFTRSRELQVLFDNDETPTLATIYGGKLTSYRIDSEQIARKICNTQVPTHHFRSTVDTPLDEATP